MWKFFSSQRNYQWKESASFPQYHWRKYIHPTLKSTAPVKPQKKTFDKLKAELKKHFEPKKVVIAKCFNFHRRNQAPDESITDYVAKLCKLTMRAYHLGRKWIWRQWFRSSLHKITAHSTHPITVKLEIQGKPVVIEVDTGAKGVSRIFIMGFPSTKKLQQYIWN